ncbi:MAG: altronate dehydratase family protein [Deltaproteobacteria bacterium]|nr:altronate dehydratase family protein [Deltaproteobacteria bacterium]
MRQALKIHPSDNLAAALINLKKGALICLDDLEITLNTDVPAKHKFTLEDVYVGGILTMYGTIVAKALCTIPCGTLVTTDNIKHHASVLEQKNSGSYRFRPPDVSSWKDRTFKGYLREDGRVATGNYWLVMPLVFCENRNAQKLSDALSDAFGFSDHFLSDYASKLLGVPSGRQLPKTVNGLDGVRCLSVTGGCGGAGTDAEALGRLLAAYADHPNVCGISVFSLGCEKLQIDMFRKALFKQNPGFSKPALYFRQQDWKSTTDMMLSSLGESLNVIKSLDLSPRTDIPLSKLKIGVKCGGSDGFSGISANPVIGVVSDMLIALGGASLMAEFPELCGAEGMITERVKTEAISTKFLQLMKAYEREANFHGTSIADNPSWGNIQDGLITDAMKSAGAAQKGGTAPISAVLDYIEPMPQSGLSLACTPGNDVLSVTGMVAAGCNLILFSTGLGTPTGNPIVPVLKIATNTEMAQRLEDMIDFDCGPVIRGASISKTAEALFEKAILAAGGEYTVKAERLGQYDFMLWKRSVDL